MISSILVSGRKVVKMESYYQNKTASYTQKNMKTAALSAKQNTTHFVDCDVFE
jgi:hypothetical protein